MSVALEYSVKTARYSADEPRKVYMIGESGEHIAFPFTFFCCAQLPVRKVHFFFNVERHKVLIMYKDTADNRFVCAEMSFSVNDDFHPHLPVRWLMMQDDVIALMHDDFKEKWGSVIMDNIINE